MEVLYVAHCHDCTELKKNPILYFMLLLSIDTAVCKPVCILC